jgi:hypothetical protein
MAANRIDDPVESRGCWPLPDLERIVLGNLEKVMHKDDLVAGVMRSVGWRLDSARKAGKPPSALAQVRRADVERSIDRLEESGFLRKLFGPLAGGFYRLTPAGKVALLLDRRDRRRARLRIRKGRRPPKPSTFPLELPDRFEDLLVDYLDIYTRARRDLAVHGIYFVGDLIQRTPQQLLAIRGFGTKSLELVEHELWLMGLGLKGAKGTGRGGGG